MEILLILIHVFVCIVLIFVVLLQSGKAADLAGAFGGGGSQTALGMRGATTLLQKATTAAAVLFMITSLALGIIGRRSESVIQGLGGDAPAVQAPATDEQTLVEVLQEPPTSGLPVPQVPESLAQRVIDGAVVPWEVVPAVRLQELVRFLTPIGERRRGRLGEDAVDRGRL